MLLAVFLYNKCFCSRCFGGDCSLCAKCMEVPTKIDRGGVRKCCAFACLGLKSLVREDGCSCQALHDSPKNDSAGYNHICIL